MDHPHGVEPIQHELHRECCEQEPEYLLGDQHAALIQVVAHPVRPAKHDHVESEDDSNEHEDDSDVADGRASATSAIFGPTPISRSRKMSRIA